MKQRANISGCFALGFLLLTGSSALAKGHTARPPRFHLPVFRQPALRPFVFRPAAPATLRPQSDPATVALIRKMLQAQNRLALEGTMVTQTAQGTFVQHAILDGARAQRYECQSPPANRGEVIVDNGRSRFHSTAAGTVDVQPSQMSARRVRVPQVMQEIRQHDLLVQRVGDGIVAGHDCVIVRVSPPYGADWYQYWIDPTNGAELRIEQYNAAGNRLSATYFTEVDYNPHLVPSMFAPLQANAAPHASPTPSQPTLPTPAQAGFTVLQPGFLPPGFRFQSATVSTRNGKNLVKLAYGNGLDALTLVETADPRQQGPKAAQIRNPRPGVVITRRNGLVLVLVGSEAEAVLENVLNSVH